MYIHIIFLKLKKRFLNEKFKILIQEDFGHVLDNMSRLTAGKKMSLDKKAYKLHKLKDEKLF